MRFKKCGTKKYSSARCFADIVDISFSGSLGKEQEKARSIISSGEAFQEFLKIITDGACECFRALEGCEAIIDLTHSTRLICDLSPS